jgi:hypothetical protein
VRAKMWSKSRKGEDDRGWNERDGEGEERDPLRKKRRDAVQNKHLAFMRRTWCCDDPVIGRVSKRGSERTYRRQPRFLIFGIIALNNIHFYGQCCALNDGKL